MSKGDGIADALENLEIFRQGLFANDLVPRCPLHALHCVKETILRVISQLVNRHDVGMFQLARNDRLRQKLVALTRILRHVGLEHFDRDSAINRSLTSGIDNAHAALAKLSQQVIISAVIRGDLGFAESARLNDERRARVAWFLVRRIHGCRPGGCRPPTFDQRWLGTTWSAIASQTICIGDRCTRPSRIRASCWRIDDDRLIRSARINGHASGVGPASTGQLRKRLGCDCHVRTAHIDRRRASGSSRLSRIGDRPVDVRCQVLSRSDNRFLSRPHATC